MCIQILSQQCFFFHSSPFSFSNPTTCQKQKTKKRRERGTNPLHPKTKRWRDCDPFKRFAADRGRRSLCLESPLLTTNAHGHLTALGSSNKEATIFKANPAFLNNSN